MTGPRCHVRNCDTPHDDPRPYEWNFTGMHGREHAVWIFCASHWLKDVPR